MRKATTFFIAYLAATGFALHLAAGFLFLFQAPLYEKIKSRSLQELEDRVPFIARFREQKPEYNLEYDINLNFEPWKPKDLIHIGPAEQRIYSDHYPSLQEAANALNNGDTFVIKPGVYQQAVIIKANNITVAGIGHVILEKEAAKGKGLLLIQGDNTRITNIECRHVMVSDRNGSCVRLEGSNLELDHVYFHSSQQGLLTGGAPGNITITDSRFAKLGKAGRAHGIYVGGGKLLISKSVFIAAKDQGHEIKSRARENLITHSQISSMSSDNSRLIDIANGGSLIVKDSLLHQGPRSVNADVIGFSLESKPPEGSFVKLERNTIIMERNGPDRLLHTKSEVSDITIADNLIIGEESSNFEERNITYPSRNAAGLPDYPTLLKQPSRAQ